jgi:ribosomal protein S18 acetylase RimI-like enzyme
VPGDLCEPGPAEPGSPAEPGARCVRALQRRDLTATAAMLARAFADDPLMAWIFPDQRLRDRRLPAFFRTVLRTSGLRHAGTEILLAAGQVLGCANWQPPGAWRQPARQQLAALPGLALALRTRLGVASETYGTLLRAHPLQPHWYLAGIGTDPPAQGNGIGSELLRSRLARCDAAGLPAYLESSKERNVPLYQRHGFVVTRELKIPRGGPLTWLMWRAPLRTGPAGRRPDGQQRG